MSDTKPYTNPQNLAQQLVNFSWRVATELRNVYNTAKFGNGNLALQQLNQCALLTNVLNSHEIDLYNKWFEEGLAKIEKINTAYSSLESGMLTGIKEYDTDTLLKNLQLNAYEEQPYLLWIVAGQSNAVGTLKGSKGTESARYCAKYWDWRTGQEGLKPLEDPVYSCTTGSAWPAFCREIYALTGRKSIILNVAKGGANVTGLSTNTWYGDTCACRVNATTAWNGLKSALTTAGINYELAGMLWVQGCSDAGYLSAGKITVDDYLNGTDDVFSFFRTLTGKTDLPVYLSVIGGTTSYANNATLAAAYETIRQAQRDYPKRDSLVYVAYDGAESFMTLGWMNDTIHYNQQGYNTMGKSLARRYVSTLNS